VEVKLPLVTLKSRRSRGFGEDVALDEIIASGSLVEAFAEIVCGALTLQLQSFGLQSSMCCKVSRL
jgi:hypothetical protein